MSGKMNVQMSDFFLMGHFGQIFPTVYSTVVKFSPVRAAIADWEKNHKSLVSGGGSGGRGGGGCKGGVSGGAIGG